MHREKATCWVQRCWWEPDSGRGWMKGSDSRPPPSPSLPAVVLPQDYWKGWRVCKKDLTLSAQPSRHSCSYYIKIADIFTVSLWGGWQSCGGSANALPLLCAVMWKENMQQHLPAGSTLLAVFTYCMCYSAMLLCCTGTKYTNSRVCCR